MKLELLVVLFVVVFETSIRIFVSLLFVFSFSNNDNVNLFLQKEEGKLSAR